MKFQFEHLRGDSSLQVSQKEDSNPADVLLLLLVVGVSWLLGLCRFQMVLRASRRVGVVEGHLYPHVLTHVFCVLKAKVFK